MCIFMKRAELKAAFSKRGLIRIRSLRRLVVVVAVTKKNPIPDVLGGFINI